MSRINLTLDDDTHTWLMRHATKAKQGIASFARELLREAMTQREELARRRKLAADYAVGRTDAEALLRDFEAPQLEGLLDEP